MATLRRPSLRSAGIVQKAPESNAARDAASVDVDVDGVACGLVEFDHGVSVEFEHVLDEHPRSTELDAHLK